MVSKFLVVKIGEERKVADMSGRENEDHFSPCKSMKKNGPRFHDAIPWEFLTPYLWEVQNIMYKILIKSNDRIGKIVAFYENYV
jgi:hypothetical protein